MATKRLEMCLYVVIFALMICRGAMAQSSCSTTLMTLMPCLSYVTGNVSTPAPTCCTSLSNVVQSQPLCLCLLLNSSGSGSSVALAVNRTLAMGLPSVCNVQTPPVSQCNAVANGPAPAGAPALAPGPAALNTPTDASTEPAQTPTTTTTIPSIPSGTRPGTTGSRTGPNTGSTSDGTSIKSSIHLPVVALFVLAWIANTSIFKPSCEIS